MNYTRLQRTRKNQARRGGTNTKQTLFVCGLLLVLLTTFIIVFYLPNAVRQIELTKILAIDDENTARDTSQRGHDEAANFLHNVMHDHSIPERFLKRDKYEFSYLHGFDANRDVSQIREIIRNMTQFAWSSYRKYAFGYNELKPLSKKPHNPGIFGNEERLGATIVDSLDTLYIMGLNDEYEEGRKWILDNLVNGNAYILKSEVSVFEVNIRFIGGLLSMHSLTSEQMYLDAALNIARQLLPAFNTPNGIPYSLINPSNNQSKNYAWSINQCSILSEVGSLRLEFDYLSNKTGETIFLEKVNKIHALIEDLARQSDMMHYNYIQNNQKDRRWCAKISGIGALADSYYEYLLKYWIYKNKSDASLLEYYMNSMDRVQTHLIGKSSVEGLSYVGELVGDQLMPKMGHLTCFLGGLYALTIMSVPDQSLASGDRNVSFHTLADNITSTCHESYVRSDTHLGPEYFWFTGAQNNKPEQVARTSYTNEMYYALRPEVIESYFYMWRLTKQAKYREWAWDAAKSIETYCRTNAGYSGLRNVYDKRSQYDNVQQSYFLAETLKYLYLIFSDDDVLPLDKYVFNTEAHPLLINKFE